MTMWMALVGMNPNRHHIFTFISSCGQSALSCYSISTHDFVTYNYESLALQNFGATTCSGYSCRQNGYKNIWGNIHLKDIEM